MFLEQDDGTTELLNPSPALSSTSLLSITEPQLVSRHLHSRHSLLATCRTSALLLLNGLLLWVEVPQPLHARPLLPKRGVCDLHLHSWNGQKLRLQVKLKRPQDVLEMKLRVVGTSILADRGETECWLWLKPWKVWNVLLPCPQKTLRFLVLRIVGRVERGGIPAIVRRWKGMLDGSSLFSKGWRKKCSV